MALKRQKQDWSSRQDVSCLPPIPPLTSCHEAIMAKCDSDSPKKNFLFLQAQLFFLRASLVLVNLAVTLLLFSLAQVSGPGLQTTA